MSMEKSQGLILRVTDFSETSRIVVIMTRDFGRISSLAKGGRRLKGPFESALDLLARCDVVFIRKSSGTLDLLTEAKLQQRFRPAEKSLQALYAGYYVAELLLALTEDYDPHPALYDEAVAALDRFQDAEQVVQGVLQFELILLREIGQLPDFHHCAGCGASLHEGDVFGYWVSQGGLICPACRQDEYTQLTVHAGTAAALRMLSSELAQAPARLKLAPQQIREARQILTTTMSHLLGYRPKTLAMLGGR